jgi:hypothetical protein
MHIIAFINGKLKQLSYPVFNFFVDHAKEMAGSTSHHIEVVVMSAKHNLQMNLHGKNDTRTLGLSNWVAFRILVDCPVTGITGSEPALLQNSDMRHSFNEMMDRYLNMLAM